MDTALADISGFIKSLGSASILALVYVFAHIIYNVSFHPLSTHPGSKLWAASRIPWCYYQYRGQLHYRLLEMHLKYGHTVRVAPNELSYTDEAAWKTIYGHGKKEMAKDPIFRLHSPTGAQNLLVADRETHTRQRRLLSHAFSESALREQEPVLQLYMGKLREQLLVRCRKGPLDIVAWLTYTSFDLIGHMSFGENFKCLDTGEYAPFVRSISAMASELAFTQMWKYWGIMGVRRFFTPRGLVGQRQKNVGKAVWMVQQRVERGSGEHRDFLHYILAANDDKGMSREEINVNAFSLSIAGSESPATALSGAVFLMLTHPPVYRRLVDEVRSALPWGEPITLVSTRKLLYLDAVITETLRLYPPVAITLPRQVPGDEAVDIAGVPVPPSTTVGVHPYSTFHHPDNFHRPTEFLPERWLPPRDEESTAEWPFAADKRGCMQPFSFGPRNCLGKNIAWAEMKLVLANLLCTFDWQLEPGQERWMQQKVQGFWQKKPLFCKLTPVQESAVW